MKRATETRPEHCFDWLTADDLVRIAVQAFAASRIGCRPPPGEHFMCDGSPWMTRAFLVDDLAVQFERRLKAHAWQQGIHDRFEGDAVWVARFSPTEPAAHS